VCACGSVGLGVRGDAYAASVATETTHWLSDARTSFRLSKSAGVRGKVHSEERGEGNVLHPAKS